MRTTTEIIEAARMGEPCTEEELRLCIISMRAVLILNHSLNAKIAGSDDVPRVIKMKAKVRFDSINTGFNIPVDERVGPEHHYNNPELPARKALADKVVKAATNRAQR